MRTRRFIKYIFGSAIRRRTTLQPNHCMNHKERSPGAQTWNSAINVLG